MLRGDGATPWQPDLTAANPEQVTSIEIPVTDFLGGAPDAADGDGD